MRRALRDSTTGKVLAATAVLLAVATVVGLVALWPDGRSDEQLGQSLRPPTEQAEVRAIEEVPCQNPAEDDCQLLTIELLSGPDEGGTAELQTGGASSDPDIEVGDRLRVARNEIPEGQGAPGSEQYFLTDFERRGPMLWLVLGFVALVVAAGRWRGLRALAGLALSILAIIHFVVPAILDGREPLLVALVGSFAIMFVTISLAHGLGAKSLAAMLGTASSLLLTTCLALAFTELAHLTGFSSEEATLLQATAGDISLTGLVLAGMVIGALGVLDDVTVSQASAVVALRRANPAQRFGELYRGAIAVGRDHVAATVNTLVLAYAGAALPILLVFSVGDTAFADAVNGEAVAEEVVSTLVGSIGLIAAVPVTTALAALLVARLPSEALEGEVAHVH